MKSKRIEEQKLNLLDKMQITFHGAARTVTGSKHLLELKNGKKVLLDCGLFQGGKDSDELNLHFGFSPLEVDAVILSHAHIDHSGLLPKLFKEGFKGKIHCSDATADLVKILLKDSAKIQEENIEYINKRRAAKGQKEIKPLYTLEDAEKLMPLLKVEKMNEYFDVVEDLTCMYTDAGHILGSCVVNLSIKEDTKERRICFTGDVGRYSNPIIKSPEKFPQADILISESTYGDSLHDDVAINEKNLEDIILHTCVEKRGKLIIPAFSVGRTQELVYALNRLDVAGKLPDIKVYVDSPLSFEATEVTRNHPECYNRKIREFLEKDEDPFSFKGLFYITDREESIALNQKKEPCIIISASGMAEFGRIKHHIANNIQDPKNSILIVGYCEPNSLGARLQNDDTEVKIFGEYFQKNAEIKKIKSFSAHADYSDLFTFLSCQDPKKVEKVFLVHGEYDVQCNFQNKLLIKKGFDFVEIPEIHQRYLI